jgi:hypothetical protein
MWMCREDLKTTNMFWRRDCGVGVDAVLSGNGDQFGVRRGLLSIFVKLFRENLATMTELENVLVVAVRGAILRRYRRGILEMACTWCDDSELGLQLHILVDVVLHYQGRGYLLLDETEKEIYQ